jgi:hypothetical protein
VVLAEGNLLTPRWTPLIHNPAAVEAVEADVLYKFVCAGRGSGKSEEFKRWIVEEANAHGVLNDRTLPGLYHVYGPTWQWVKDKWWGDLKALVPRDLVDGRPRDSDLQIRLITGTEIRCYGVDQPMRIEGDTVDGGVGDEFQQWKPSAWPSSIRPCYTRRGRKGRFVALFRPKGKNHAWQTWMKARRGELPHSAGYHWTSEAVLDPEVLAAERATLSPELYAQEYGAQVGDVQNRAYSSFHTHNYAPADVDWHSPDLPLLVAADFNVQPGVLAIGQVRRVSEAWPKADRQDLRDVLPVIFDEVYIPTDSSTRLVFETFCRRYALGEAGRKVHRGRVIAYGDPAGGARSTASTDGRGDRAAAREVLQKYFPGRFSIDVPDAAPAVLDRINTTNSACISASGVVGLLICPVRAPESVRSFEATQWKLGTDARVINKPKDDDWTHLADGVSYMLQQRAAAARRRVFARH